MTKSNQNPSSTHTLTMSPSSWLQVQANPRQRNTERHLVRASKYLINPSQTHAEVSAAKLPTGELIKLDGHTRALFWDKNPQYAPKEVRVTVYIVESLAESLELYTHFDNIKAVENTSDRVYGAFEQANWHPKSRYFTSGAVGQATAMAQAMVQNIAPTTIAKETPIYDLVSLWLPEFKLMDGLEPESKHFTAPITAACLLTLRKYGEKALEFWTLYNNDQGTKLENEIDGIEALHKIRQKTKGGTYAERIRLIGRAISCFEAYRDGRCYKNVSASGPRQTDVVGYMK